jgi:hypothetical protein
MDVLNNIALPQSTGHFHLLLFIFNLVGAVFVPYFALLLGSMVTALLAERQARAEGALHGLRLAKDLVDMVLPSKGFFIFLAVLPALSMVFVYAQVLQATPAIATGVAALGVLFSAIATRSSWKVFFTPSSRRWKTGRNGRISTGSKRPRWLRTNGRGDTASLSSS